MIVAGTGHRPDKLGGYDRSIRYDLEAFACHVLTGLNPSVVISGMALGWDQALAHAAVERGIPLWAYLPFEGQEMRWPDNARRRYRKLVAVAAKTRIISAGGFSPGAMQRRNEAMVDDADRMLSLWNGEKCGGTWNCMLYARDSSVPCSQLWQHWQDWHAGLILI